MLAVGLLEILSEVSSAATPFHILTLLIFLAAITHTLLAHHFTSLANKVAKKGENTVLSEILHFLGEIEVVFAAPKNLYKSIHCIETLAKQCC